MGGKPQGHRIGGWVLKKGGLEKPFGKNFHRGLKNGEFPGAFGGRKGIGEKIWGVNPISNSPERGENLF